MSGFVNANALLSYIPLCYLTEPYTITGHCFALRRATFNAIGGLGGMAGRLDDDHELARRVRQAGLRNEQTPLVYDVDNPLDTWQAYNGQLKRWFVFPRQMMLPQLTPREQAISFLGSAGNLLPGLLAALALTKRSRPAWAALVASLALFAASYAWCEACYLGRRTPWRRWPLLLVVALVTPWHVLSALFSDDVVEWRGQRLRVQRGGYAQIVNDKA
jgi:ceramide glucosyltransferase